MSSQPIVAQEFEQEIRAYAPRVTVPAEYADDFRAAVVEEIAETAAHVQTARKELVQSIRERDPKADIAARDLAGAMLLLARDARLLVEVGQGSGEIQLEIDADGTLAHVFESMARDVVASPLTDALGATPIEPEYAAELKCLMDELSWAIEQAGRCHAEFAHVAELEAS